MSYAERTNPHHLTPSGWVNEQAAPADAVEIWKRVYEPASDPWPRPRITYPLAWVSLAVFAEKRAALHAQFERPEDGVSAQVAELD